MSLLALATDSDFLSFYRARENNSCRTARSAAKFAILPDDD